MKVLQVIDQLNVGGAERVLVDLSNILHQHGEEVTVLTLVRPGKLASQLSPDIQVIDLKRQFRFSLYKMFQLNRICRQFDVVHVHLRYNFRYVALAKYFFGGKFKLLLHDHFGDIENDKSIPFGLKFFLHRNPWFTGVSQPLVDWAVQYVGLGSERVFLLPNIIVRKELNHHRKPETSIVRIVLVSNFREAKNHVFACRLLATLRGSLNFTATFIGQVIDQKFMKRVYEEISNSDLDDVVTVINDCTDVQSEIGTFDLAIHTAYQESGPLVLIEYLAQQLPFVAYKTGEVSTQIESIIPEFFLNNFQVEQWVERIKTVLHQPRQYTKSMQEAFDSLYSDKVYYTKSISIYSQMVVNG